MLAHLTTTREILQLIINILQETWNACPLEIILLGFGLLLKSSQNSTTRIELCLMCLKALFCYRSEKNPFWSCKYTVDSENWTGRGGFFPDTRQTLNRAGISVLGWPLGARPTPKTGSLQLWWNEPHPSVLSALIFQIPWEEAGLLQTLNSRESQTSRFWSHIPYVSGFSTCDCERS